MRLTIKEISDLKEGRKNLNEILIKKTHDGTSSTPIKAQFEDFYKESSGSMYRHTRVVSSDGKELTHVLSIADEKHNEDQDIEIENVFNQFWDYDNTSDAHLLVKPTGEDNSNNVVFYDKNGNAYFFPNSDDMYITEELNDDVEYIFRSLTLVNDDGTSTTLIKNNKFSSDNAKKLRNMVPDIEKDIKNHEQQLINRTNEIHEEHMKQWEKDNPLPNTEKNSPELRAHNAKRWKEEEKSKKQAQKQAMDELGDTKTYVQENWSNRIEEECNVKLKMQKQNVKKYTGFKNYDEDDYGEDWAEYHEIYDQSVGGGAFPSMGAFWQWKEGN